jgi:hypothetical protein
MEFECSNRIPSDGPRISAVDFSPLSEKDGQKVGGPQELEDSLPENIPGNAQSNCESSKYGIWDDSKNLIDM